jgi:hypothetical protein
MKLTLKSGNPINPIPKNIPYVMINISNMRLLKITALTMISASVLLFLYANLRKVSPSEKLRHVSLATFSVEQKLSEEIVANLQKEIKSTNGVTACKINGDGQIASVIYHADVISEKSLQDKISRITNLKISIKSFENTGGGCPVDKFGSSFSGLVSALDLR